MDSLKVVGSLCLRTSIPSERLVEYDILANDDFELGRRRIESDLEIKAPSVSNHHLRFRCVTFDEDGEIRVAPMVYVRVLSKNTVWLSSAHQKATTALYSGDPDFLLDNEDMLHLTSTISVQFLADQSCAVKAASMSATQKKELSYFESSYQVTDRRLGAGGQADVFVAIEKQTQRQVACKVVRVPFLSASDMEDLCSDPRMTVQEQIVKRQRLHANVLKSQSKLCREFDILKKLSHPNIITLHRVFHAPRNVYIFEDLITGGDLLSYLEMKGTLGEPQSAVIIRQILKAVEYLHDNSIVHRDIKPENILMTSWRDGARVVLTDFGQARTLEDTNAAAKDKAVFRMQSVVGTAGYTAPEVLRQTDVGADGQGYSKAVDIWSIGCITSCLLTGKILFEQVASHDKPRGNSVTDAYQASDLRAFNRDLMNTSVRWRGIGRKAKSFVRECAAENEKQRLTAKQALRHAWFANQHYALELEAAYKRAIQDWEPRVVGQDIIEFIGTSTPADETGLLDNARSRYFPAKPVKNTKSMFYSDNPQNEGGASEDVSEGPEVLGGSKEDCGEEEGISLVSTIVPIVTQYHVDSGI